MNRYEEARRGGLYLGAGIVGSIIGNIFYAFWFSTNVGIGPAPVPAFLSLAFVAVAAVFCWNSRQMLERLAWIAFAGYQAMNAFAAIADITINRAVSGFLLFAWAALWMAAGLRPIMPRRIVIAGSVFLVMVLLSASARYYGDDLLGRHTVMRPR
jgi:hypothetical protein